MEEAKQSRSTRQKKCGRLPTPTSRGRIGQQPGNEPGLRGPDRKSPLPKATTSNWGGYGFMKKHVYVPAILWLVGMTTAAEPAQASHFGAVSYVSCPPRACQPQSYTITCKQE